VYCESLRSVNNANNNNGTSGTPQPTNSTDNRVNAVATQTFTLLIFQWEDSFLCLNELYVQAFIRGNPAPVTPATVTGTPTANPIPATVPTAGTGNAAAATPQPYVFWNNRQGICKLVPLSQLRAAFTSCRPKKIVALEFPINLFDVMFSEIFGNQPPGSFHYHVVGGLDSNSQGSNFLQWRIKEAWKLLNPQAPVPQVFLKRVQALIAQFEEIATAQQEAQPRIEQDQPRTGQVLTLIAKIETFIEKDLPVSAQAEVPSSQAQSRNGQVQILIAQTEARIEQAQPENIQAQDQSSGAEMKGKL
jgi:hypothetical protein